VIPKDKPLVGPQPSQPHGQEQAQEQRDHGHAARRQGHDPRGIGQVMHDARA
jgi:hypothetical protein